MSRIGKRVLTIPEKVNVELNEQTLTVKGPKGELTLNIDKCIKLIKKCLKQISEGKIKTENISAAKNTIISAIKSSDDTPMGIINTYFSKILVKADNNEERIEKFSSITKEDVIKVSKKVSLHTILTLENKEEEHEEN